MCNFSRKTQTVLILKWQQFLSFETECWKMGCVTSKTDINDHHPNIFEVVNVDGMCNPKKPGQMEVCDTDLVWYERGKPPVIWPLKHLRRYGHDGDLFSFECGRRCPSGPGIYAFKSSRAAQLFKQVQDQVNLQTRNNVAEEVLPEFTPRQQATESNYLEPAPLQLRQNGAVNRFSGHNGRLNSVASSSGPLSPLTLSPSPPPPPPMPPPPPQLPVDDQVFPHSYSNTTSLSCEPAGLAMYANIDLTPTSTESVPLAVSQAADGSRPEVEEVVEDPPTTPVYMNVALPPAFVLSDPPPRPVVVENPDDQDERHSYANLDVGEIEMLKGKERYSAKFQFLSLPSTPPPQQINYIQLDLDQSTSLVLNQPMSPATPTEKSPDKLAEGYATIDFDRTVALCAVSCERTMQEAADEGCRKTRHDSFMGDESHRSVEVRRTRHNSTISELMAPITSRLSTSFSE